MSVRRSNMGLRGDQCFSRSREAINKRVTWGVQTKRGDHARRSKWVTYLLIHCGPKYMYQALANKTPPPRKKGGGGVFNLFDFDSEKLPGFYSFQKSWAKLRWVFIYSKKNRPLRGRVFILGIFYKEIPTNNSIFSKISARFARGLLFIPKKFRALRARVFILFNFPKMTVGFYSFQFRFLKKPVRVLI